MKNFEDSHEVCHCQNVTLGKIIYTIKSKNVTSLGQLQEKTGAGTLCRCCLIEEADSSKMKKKLYCKEILDYYKED